MNSVIKKISLKIVVLSVLLSSSASFAQGDLKIVVLDMTSALFNSERALLVNEELREETAVDEQKVRDLAEEAQTLQDDLQQNAAVLSEADQRRKAEDIQEIAVQYEFLMKKIEANIQEKRQEFQQTYAPNLIQAINELVEEEQYDFVLRSEAALFFNSAVDITAKVTEKLNQQ